MSDDARDEEACTCGRALPSCSEVLERLWDYIDDELHPPTAEAVRAHLDRCQRCYPRFDFHRAYREYVRHQEVEPVPPALRRRVFRALLEADADDGPA